MKPTLAVFRRELGVYFTTPLAYLFLGVFLLLTGFQTLQRDFFEARQASLRAMFESMPLLLILLVPAIAMRLWAEERRTNSVELLLTLPITATQATLGKFFAAWAVLLIGLGLTFPMVLTVTWLGDPDPGPMITGYLGTALLAGAYLAVGTFASALTRSQVVSFVIAAALCGALLQLGSPAVLELVVGVLPGPFVDMVEAMSLQVRFDSMLRGVLELRDLVYFVGLTAGWLMAAMLLVQTGRAAR